jgi:ABC-2 type transport system ATP-binding protein
VVCAGCTATRGVHDLDLEVPAGTIFALIGPSGSGKSTTVRMVLGLEAPDEGELQGARRRPRASARQTVSRIGYMPQSLALYRDLSLRHNLQFVASLYGMPWRGRWARSDAGKAARGRVVDTLAFLGLTEQQGTRLRDASGGEQRRLGLAAALIHEPSLLILDEPTAGIDPMLRREIWDRLRHLRDAGVTVFVTTQYVEEAAHCDLVAILADGVADRGGHPGRASSARVRRPSATGRHVRRRVRDVAATSRGRGARQDHRPESHPEHRRVRPTPGPTV